MIDTTFFQSSDLAGAKRREFIGAGRSGRALLRDTDGFPLALVPLAQLESILEVAKYSVAATLVAGSITAAKVRPSDLGIFAWLANFDADDRAEFFDELRDALAIAIETEDAGPVHTCLKDWQRTAAALSDPKRRAILTGPGNTDYVAVERPG